MDKQSQFYVKDARELNVIENESDLRWFIYERLNDRWSKFVCACLDEEAARRVMCALLARAV